MRAILSTSSQGKHDRAFRRLAGQLLPFIIFLAGTTYFYFYIRTFSQYPIDDSFIHLRIARNFAENGQPYYNLGEAVMGGTPHLWILLLAIGLNVFGSASFIPYLELVLTTGTFLLSASLLRSRFSAPLSLLLGFVVIALCLLDQAGGLMETPLAVFMLLASSLASKKNRPLLTGVFAGLAIWVRLEFVLWLPIAFFALPDRKSRRAFLIGALPIFVSFILFDLHYFGTLVPQPAISKTRVFSLAFKQFIISFPPVSWNHHFYYVLFPNETVRVWMFGAFQVIFCALALRMIKLREVSRESRALTIFSIALWLVYFLRSSMMFSWYVPIFVVPLALVLLSEFKNIWSMALLFCFAGACLNLFYNTMSDQFALISGLHHYHEEYAPGWRTRTYLRVGEDLAKTMPTASVMSSEIGALGWTFHGKIFDGLALVSPEMLKYHPLRVPQDRISEYVGALPSDAVRDFKPDIVVTMPIFQKAFLRDQVEGDHSYVLERRYPLIPRDKRLVGDDDWVFAEGNSEILVYKRR